MITIKINSKKKEIKKYSELTLKAYTELIELIKNEKDFNVFHYIAFQTGYKFDDLQLQKVTNLKLLSDTLEKLRVVKGETKENIHCIEDLKPWKYYKFKNYFFNTQLVKMSSKLGYRAVIEQYMQNKPSYLDIYVFTLATVIRERKYNDFDYDSILQIVEELKDSNAYDTLSIGAFFFGNLIHGELRGQRCLRALKRILTKTNI